MKTVSTPHGLKAAVAFLALCIPLSMTQAVLMTSAPWWKLPYLRFALSAIPAGACWLLISVLLLKGLRAGYAFFIAAGAAWLLIALFEMLRLHSVSLAFYAIAVSLFLLLDWAWLRVELGRSFFDPQMHWYEGLPRPIPGLSCQIASGQKTNAFRVSRIDREGAFVFKDRRAFGKQDQASQACQELVFAFRDREVRCLASPVRAFSRAEGFCGMGFKFDRMPPDACKRLGDFVEALKGEGYVS
jgi:hypothetical protein